MKKSIRSIIAVILAITAILCAVSCGKEETPDVEGLWQNTTYKADTELGSGAKTVKVEYKLEEKVITFTIHNGKTELLGSFTKHRAILHNGGNGRSRLTFCTVAATGCKQCRSRQQHHAKDN